ncbi:hypothetical protein MP638_004835 [Amoeboaphelidium occidentale]|nr:hypothetical protein MP638_004835 [Amoeboaphelidium occidentale]
MINVRPSKIGLLPCLIILFLWFFIPPPQIPKGPEIDPVARQAALKALEASNQKRNLVLQEQAEAEPSGILGNVQRLSRFSLPSFTSCDKAAPSSPKALIVTAVAPKPCSAPGGDFLTMLSIKNKQDYARLHGYGFYLSTEQSDPLLKGAWNKVALVRDLLKNSTEKYEWIVWMDYDALIMDMKFKIPFTEYKSGGFDLVLWGQERELFELGDAHMGLNTGVFYVRNTQWSRDLFQETSIYGHDNGKKHEEVLKAELGNYDWALFDQNGFCYVLKTWNNVKLNKRKTKLENGYVLNGYWKDWIDLNGKSLPFVKHFMGCQFCSGINKAEGDLCRSDFESTYEVANSLSAV